MLVVVCLKSALDVNRCDVHRGDQNQAVVSPLCTAFLMLLSLTPGVACGREKKPKSERKRAQSEKGNFRADLLSNTRAQNSSGAMVNLSATGVLFIAYD